MIVGMGDGDRVEREGACPEHSAGGDYHHFVSRRQMTAAATMTMRRSMRSDRLPRGHCARALHAKRMSQGLSAQKFNFHA